MSTNSKAIYRHWVQQVTLGEFIGFLIPSVVGVLSVVLNFSQAAQMAIMVLAGLGEGAILGYFQARVLRSYISKFSVGAWVKATMVGAGIAWIIGMLPSTVGEKLENVPLGVLIPLMIVLGSGLLLTMGYCQYLVLRRYIPGSYKWILVNALAWLLGLTVVMIFISAAPTGIATTIIFSILGGLGMAFTMAAITGRYIQKILHV